MEEEIDLREYIDVVIRRWKWIVGLTLVAMITAGVVSFALPPIYEATVTLAVTQPKYVLQFDPRFQALEESITAPFKAYSALVKNPELEERVLDALQGFIPSAKFTREDLEGMATVAQGDDPSVIILKIRHTNREFAVRVANTWAQLYLEQMSELYGHSPSEESYFEEQLEIAEGNLRAAEEALIDFEGHSRIAVLENTINAKKGALASNLAAQERILIIIQDAESLQHQLQLESSPSSGLASGLSILMLDVSSLSSQASLPLDLELSTDESAFLNMSIQEQIAFLGNLVSTLQAKQETITVAIEAFSPEILRLQEELQQEYTEKDRLVRARDVARETYLAVSRKVDEVRIAAASEDSGVQIVSQAVTPERPVAPRKKLNIAIAGVLGLMVGVLGAFALEYLGSPGRGRIREEKR